jgi:hypothetical protein
MYHIIITLSIGTRLLNINISSVVMCDTDDWTRLYKNNKKKLESAEARFKKINL